MTIALPVTATRPEPEDLPPALAPLRAAAPADELDVCRRILELGVDAGCFVRPIAADVLTLTLGQQESLFASIGDRPAAIKLTAADPFEQTEPPVIPIEGDDPGWAILSQRCDLLRPYKLEPLVELGRATLTTDVEIARSARLNSPRFLWLCEAEDGDGGWVVDLRHRAVLPKHRLVDQSPIAFPIPEGRPRKMFRLRVGQRYQRDAVPADIAILQVPLRAAMSKSRAKVARAAPFSAFLVTRVDGRLLLVAVLADGQRLPEAEAAFDALLTELARTAAEARDLLHDESAVFHTDQIPFGLFLDSYKLDLDEISHGRHATEDHEQPAI